MFLSFPFHKETDSVITHEANTVLICTRCIIQTSFFVKTPMYYAKHCYRKSFVVQQDRQTLSGTLSGHHSQLGPACCAFHFLNDLIILLHPELQNIYRNPCFVKMLLHQKLQNYVQWPGRSHWRRVSRGHLEFEGSPEQHWFSPQNSHISSSFLSSGVEVQDNIWTYFTLIYHRDSLWQHIVTSRHIPQLTRPNSSAVMKCYRRLHLDAVQCVLGCLFLWVLLWTGITRLRQLPSTPHPYWRFFDFEYRVLLIFTWLPFRTNAEVIY